MTDRIDFEQVREVVRIATEGGVAELEVAIPSLKVRVRTGAGQPVVHADAGAAGSAASPGAVAATAGTPTATPAGATGPAAEDHLVPIVAPMVGTFYRAPAPDAPPFVKEGDHVTPGQVVCIIEAMKLFNEIQAEVGGRLARVLVDNASPVEYGQPLFLIEPALEPTARGR
ncbi:MAG: acetyl-CoA carboxylase biotin carboxyl carrier protein [Armatimonadota bacterium]|nr:acetyl-CoA carboxylase biotin carboxyl carrier protein [Armatimonadota bacterium]